MIQPQAPAFSVAGGDLTPEELAALAVVISALRRVRGRPHAPENPNIAGGWKSYWHTVRWPMYPGHGSWRSTLRR